MLDLPAPRYVTANDGLWQWPDLRCYQPIFAIQPILATLARDQARVDSKAIDSAFDR